MVDVVRKLIIERLQELGLNRVQVSHMLGRNETYIQQFLTKGSPRELHERDRVKLAEILKVPEESLRGPSSPVQARGYAKQQPPVGGNMVDVLSSRRHIPIGTAPGTIPGADLFGIADLPVYGTSQRGDGVLTIIERAVDWVARPSSLLRVQDGHGLIVARDTMEPVIRAGSTILINPHLPPRIGDLCIFRRQDDDGTVPFLVKEYRGETETGYKVRQYNPHKDFVIKKSDWPTLHRVVGVYFT